MERFKFSVHHIASLAITGADKISVAKSRFLIHRTMSCTLRGSGYRMLLRSFTRMRTSYFDNSSAFSSSWQNHATLKCHQRLQTAIRYRKTRQAFPHRRLIRLSALNQHSTKIKVQLEKPLRNDTPDAIKIRLVQLYKQTIVLLLASDGISSFTSQKKKASFYLNDVKTRTLLWSPAS